MTSQVTTANLTVSFQQETSQDGPIVLEQPNKGSLVVLCYCATQPQYATTIGRVDAKEIRYMTVQETLNFSGSSSATLQKPGASDVLISTQNGVFMEEVVNRYGKKSLRRTTAVQLSFDAASNSVIATDDAKLYGGCVVTYKSRYQVLYYYPELYSSPEAGFVSAVGSIFAYNDSTVTSLDVTFNLENKPDYVEFARVTSKIVLDARGVWEFPPSWESTYQSNKEKSPDQRSSYNTGSFASGHPPMPESEYTLDPDQSFVDERVHCIVKVSSIGTLIYEDFNNGGDDYWAWFTPYYGYSTYDPVYQITWSDPPGGAKAGNSEAFIHSIKTLNRNWQTVFLNVNKNEVRTKLQIDYPGATDGNKRR